MPRNPAGPVKSMTRTVWLGPGLQLVWLEGERPVLVTEIDEATATRLLGATPAPLPPRGSARHLHLVRKGRNP
jgi:hypothetical protein